jgi:hypothetical protein
LEEPFERLEGLTPRQASERPELTAALAGLLRVTENGAERNRAQGGPKLFDFEFAVSELGLADELGQARRGSRETDSGAKAGSAPLPLAVRLARHER